MYPVSLDTRIRGSSSDAHDRVGRTRRNDRGHHDQEILKDRRVVPQDKAGRACRRPVFFNYLKTLCYNKHIGS